MTKIPANVRFIHLRFRDENLEPSNRGGATIAYIGDVDPDGSPVTKAAVAFCNPIDNFSHYLGRVKAAGRLQQLGLNSSLVDDNRYHIIPGDDPLEAARHVATELSSLYGYSYRKPDTIRHDGS